MDRIKQITLSADGRQLCFAEWGDPSGPPVFALHGTPGCRLLSSRKVEFHFDEVLSSTGVRLITYDRPGYGRSDRQRGRRVMDAAADVAAIADALGLDRFAVEGSSSGTAHAMAVAALLPGRVGRLALVAPMAPYQVLGHDRWSAGQSDGVREYVSWCLEGEARLAGEVAAEDGHMREGASPDDPKQAETFEQTANGPWGWVDDELAAFQPWGFEVHAIVAPTAIWHDPDEDVLPRQHAEWLASRLKGATLSTSVALGHRADGDPTRDWSRVYSWLGGHQPTDSGTVDAQP
jgi:pimeloyl-ACP methyl ester carboxylesterase